MLKSAIAAVAILTALMAPAVPAEAGPLRKAIVIGSTVIVTGLVIRCGVRTASGRSCL